MTNLQEAKLAREAEICYTTIALVTDYDCWHPDHDQVTVEMIVANLVQNAKTAQQVIANAVDALPFARTCECASALKHAIITRPEAIPADVKRDLAPIVGKYAELAATFSGDGQSRRRRSSRGSRRKNKGCFAVFASLADFAMSSFPS